MRKILGEYYFFILIILYKWQDTVVDIEVEVVESVVEEVQQVLFMVLLDQEIHNLVEHLTSPDNLDKFRAMFSLAFKVKIFSLQP
jgi:hypothetical protein